MSSLLVLGGTGWVGREIAATARDAGHRVTCLARGMTGEAPPGVRFVARDRRDPDAFDALDDHYDEVVEVSYDPALTRPALAALAPRAAHWTLVSTISVYAPRETDAPDEPLADETAPVLEPPESPDPANREQYGAVNVLAERDTAAALGERLLIVRPGLICGPGDPTDRFGYWPARFARAARAPHGGPVLTPPDGPVQVIDVADLAAFIVSAGSARHTGVLDAVGELITLNEVLRLAAAATGYVGDLRRADAAWLVARDVAPWAGPRSLPLWLPEDAHALMRRSNDRYRAHGGTLRPLTDTMARVLADETARGLDRERSSGLGAEVEAELLA